jgi:hypothetical protein
MGESKKEKGKEGIEKDVGRTKYETYINRVTLTIRERCK